MIWKLLHYTQMMLSHVDKMTEIIANCISIYEFLYVLSSFYSAAGALSACENFSRLSSCFTYSAFQLNSEPQNGNVLKDSSNEILSSIVAYWMSYDVDKLMKSRLYRNFAVSKVIQEEKSVHNLRLKADNSIFLH
jgi:hypothetical protein